MKKQNVFVIVASCLLLLITVCSFYIGPVQSRAGHGIKTIIVDAGHGGSDPGCIGEYSKEKDIALAISFKLAKALREALPDVKVEMTRTTDVFQDVRLKAKLANEYKGDLFLCVHANSLKNLVTKFNGYKKEVYYTGKGKSKKKHIRKVPTYRKYYVNGTARGTETYIFAAHKTDDKEKAILENSEWENEKDDSTDNMDYNSPEATAMALLYTKKYFQQSYKLAQMVEASFKASGRISRGVMQRQKGIRVLQSTNMPSILIETGYITTEEDYLNSQKGQQEVADAVVKAVEAYKASVENPHGSSTSNGGH